MGPFSMVVLIVMVAAVLKARYRAMGRIADQPPLDNPDRLRADDELRQLKARVAVLERVITDNHGSLDLDREIQRLRDN